MSEQQHYELGYLLSPLVAPEALAETVEREVKAPLTKVGAELKTETAPKLQALAYPLKKIVEHKGSTFREAYFGACAFDLAPEKMVQAEENLKKSPLVVRFLITSLPARAFRPNARGRAPVIPSPEAEGPVAPVAPAKMSAEALDREIDGLLAPAV